MRCLRSIGDAQPSGHVYLSDENIQILDDELQQNFRVSIDESRKQVKTANASKSTSTAPSIKIKLKRVRRLYNVREKQPPARHQPRPEPGRNGGLQTHPHLEREGLDRHPADIPPPEDISHLREKRVFGRLTLVAEIARYLNKPCLEIETILATLLKARMVFLTAVNEFNELLYD